MTNYIDYDQIVQKSLLQAVRDILQGVEKEGLKGAHHFYLSFRTDRSDVQIPAFLKERHPYEITVVMQHQFWDLKVYPTYFMVTLSFNSNLETIRVPFSALISFVDPSVKFGLQFNPSDTPDTPGFEHPVVEDLIHTQSAPVEQSASSGNQGSDIKTNNVVALDLFRKK